MRVLWVSHSSRLGGAESCLVEGIDALTERGHELHVVMPEEGPLAARLRPRATVHVCWLNRWMSDPLPPPKVRTQWLVYDLIQAGRAIGRIAGDVAADLVVTNTLVIVAGAAGAAWARRPHVWFIHEFGTADHGFRFHVGRRPSLVLLNRLSERVLVNSEAVRGHFGRWLPTEKLRLARYAVDMPVSGRSAPPPGPPYRLVLVGTRQRGKGQQDAVAATAMLAHEGFDVRLELIGSASSAEFESELATLVREKGLEDRVSIAGFDERALEKLAEAHVALVCSRSEALGRVTVEALKLGTPVVGARGGATPEMIRDDWNGLLYPPGDPRALADAVSRLLTDPVAAEAMGERGRAWALGTFTRAGYAVDLERAFEEALGRRPP